MGNEGKEGGETEKFDFFGKVELLSGRQGQARQRSSTLPKKSNF